MTTRLELDYQGETLTVTGEYRKGSPARFNPLTGDGHDGTASEFWIARIEQDGEDVIACYSDDEMEEIEILALEIIEGD